jgi:hypothetical protein
MVCWNSFYFCYTCPENPFSDGLRGALIIYDPEDPQSYLYDVDDGLCDHDVLDLLTHKYPQIPPSSPLLTGTSLHFSTFFHLTNQKIGTMWLLQF